MLIRPVRTDDAEQLLAMQHRHQIAALGRPDCTLDDVRDQLADPDLDPMSPVVEADDGTLLGCAMVFHDGASDHADLDVVVDPGPGRPLLPRLLADAVELAAEGARRRGHSEVRADQGCYRGDVHLAAALDAAQFVPATSFHRMRRDLDEPVGVRRSDDVHVERHDAPTEPALERAYRLHEASFAGHFGFEPRTWEEWRANIRSRTGTGPLWFAVVGGEDVGYLYETDQFVSDENAGYVWQLGVVRAARGRGIAKTLLLSSFAEMRERGRVAALLHVDSANSTGATRLYESVGMTPVLVIDMWRRTRETS